MAGNLSVEKRPIGQSGALSVQGRGPLVVCPSRRDHWKRHRPTGPENERRSARPVDLHRELAPPKSKRLRCPLNDPPSGTPQARQTAFGTRFNAPKPCETNAKRSNIRACAK